MPTEAVNTLATGEIDYEHFRTRLQANKDKPAIVNVNIGTTVKGAVDDLDRVLEILDEEGFDEDRFYIHCDGALFGLMVSLQQHSRKSKPPRGGDALTYHALHREYTVKWSADHLHIRNFCTAHGSVQS